MLITILVLELRPPSAHSFSALLPLWPTGLSYVVSYLFIAIVFSVSLILCTTEWIADSRLAAAPVALCAAVFVLVNVTYIALCWEAVDRPAHEDVS